MGWRIQPCTLFIPHPQRLYFRKVVPKSLKGILKKTEIKVPCGKTYAKALTNYPSKLNRSKRFDRLWLGHRLRFSFVRILLIYCDWPYILHFCDLYGQ